MTSIANELSGAEIGRTITLRRPDGNDTEAGRITGRLLAVSHEPPEDDDQERTVRLTMAVVDGTAELDVPLNTLAYVLETDR